MLKSEEEKNDDSCLVCVVSSRVGLCAVIVVNAVRSSVGEMGA